MEQYYECDAIDDVDTIVIKYIEDLEKAADTLTNLLAQRNDRPLDELIQIVTKSGIFSKNVETIERWMKDEKGVDRATSFPRTFP